MSTLKRRRPSTFFLSGERCSVKAVRHLPSGRFARRRQFVCFDERRASLWTFQTGRILFVLWSFTFFEWRFRRRRWWQVLWWLFRGRFFAFVWSSFRWVGRSSSFPVRVSQRKIVKVGQVILHLRQNVDTNHRNWNYTVTNCFGALAHRWRTITNWGWADGSSKDSSREWLKWWRYFRAKGLCSLTGTVPN